MPKENVSARVPPAIARELDSYAETWNLNRTDAMTVLLKYGAEANPEPEGVLESVESGEANYTYTLSLEAEQAELLAEMTREADYTVEDLLHQLLTEKVANYTPPDGE